MKYLFILFVKFVKLSFCSRCRFYVYL